MCCDTRDGLFFGAGEHIVFDFCEVLIRTGCRVKPLQLRTDTAQSRASEIESADKEHPGGEPIFVGPKGHSKKAAAPGLPRPALIAGECSTRALAEGVGFEPTIRFPVYTLSKRAP